MTEISIVLINMKKNFLMFNINIKTSNKTFQY